jgi:Fe(3+) dicitrate transport protein
MLVALAMLGSVFALLGPPVEPPPPRLESPADENLEEGPEPEDDLDDLDDEVREVIVDASVLGQADAIDVFTHPGGRTVVKADEMRSRGATNAQEAVKNAPGVRAVEGNSGGSSDTSLQLAVRGADPRYSGRATVLLDEIPLAPAPYGQPQLSLFPLSLFSIAEIDVVRGGATARYGPQTSGGVFNLMSNPIPVRPRIYVFSQGDSNRDLSMGGAYGATHGRFGMYLEYAPRFGKSWRDHSDKQVHGGLSKFAWQFNKRIRLESLSHAYYEDSQLPGGLPRWAYDENPFQSLRPFDYFRGSRLGTALKFSWQISDRQDFKINAWYSHTFRTTYFGSNPPSKIHEYVDDFVGKPRYYDVMGIEPRWSMRFDAKEVDFSQQLSVGARAGYEIAKLYTDVEDVGGSLRTAHVDGRTAAYAGYVNEKLIFLGGDLAIDAGLRFEFMQLGSRDLLGRLELLRNYWAPLPAASIWYAPVDEVAIFASYGRSFATPQYLQVLAAQDTFYLPPETSNGVELGLKILELAGIYGESTAWYKEFRKFVDTGEEAFDLIERVHLWGIESEFEWYPGEVWDMPGEPSMYAGYGWTGSYIVGLTYTGNQMPWYPVHEAWAGAAYALDFGLEFGVDVEYLGKQYTDLENREVETQDAAYGPIPAYTLCNLWMRMKSPLPNGWAIEFGGGVKNIGDVRYFSRTDDRNSGLLVGRPRTYYINVGFAHEFMPRSERAVRRARAAERKHHTSRLGSGNTLGLPGL